MKPLLPILLTLLISCQKSNITFKHHWIADAWHDNQLVNNAFECDSSNFLGVDTITLDNTNAIDSTKFYPAVGSIVFDPGGKVDGDRYYHELKRQLD